MTEKLAWRPRELAKALSISLRQVYRLEEQGRIRSVKIGRAKLFTDESVRALLEPAPSVGAQIDFAEGLGQCVS